MNARDVAVNVVRDVFPPKGSIERVAQEALEYRVRKAGLDARDRAFATELAYGAIKMRRTLDWYLEPFIGERTATLAPAIREVLRCAIYELRFTRADEHATVFEWVNLAKKYGHGGLGNLVNAVLRSFLRAQPAAPERASFDDAHEYLAVAYSLPTWLVRMWANVFGEERLEAICAGVNTPPAAALTAQVLRNSADELSAALDAEGVAHRRSACVPESLLIDDPARAHAFLSAHASDAWFQSESSAMAVDMLQPQPGERILDVCSGRGNKALQIAGRMLRDGHLTCVERDERRVEQLERRFAEAGVTADIILGDVMTAAFDGGGTFDRILLDAPCSGLGVVGRHPESRWKKRSDDGVRLAPMQVALLERAVSLLAPGGALLYAVCSPDPREGREVVDAVRARHHVERGLIAAQYENLLDASGDVLIAPGLDGRDGFYFARLERPA